ncbi:hypothetical protein P152DRAFT_8042 [Eremomyces bilateralis CBS 781.70]|uniref:Galactose oxidase n=1 Tax=Eremomyces bilateralis CBS 781.70 TaxID=1392243 RepID=A0A6G1GG68_9PEZI|nr:uncharacterized protein P152DRAFT_8042 [Eremomyces bilateralis CBS 781.70]KAF1817097.1 hypothetical protein P152DRAFT_8042 [Eremomyces bilateralis CBS 781.70]
MPPPEPLVPLNGHCSVINDGILYVYSPDAFQALPLKEGGEWTQLSMGIAVTGARCAHAPSDDPAASGLYIVGGSPNSTIQDFPGLQRYSFKNKSWEIISPIASVTQNRQHHGAAFLNASQSIITYGGSQDGIDGLSSQTFLISTQPPFGVRSFNSAAPPLNNPFVMPWNDSHAVMIGGGVDNRQIFTFGPDEMWADLGTTLPFGLPDHSKIQCTIMTGDDGSKVLEMFDMSVSPNAVTLLVLRNPDGSPAAPGTYIGAPPNSIPSKKRKRDLTLDQWPPYDPTLAPNATRADFSLATDPDGMAVVVGGSEEDPLCIFSQRENSWMNASAVLGVKDQDILTSQFTSSSVSLLSSATATQSVPSPSSTTSAAEAAAGSSMKSKRLTVLGATLGAIFGIAALLILLLLLLRWRKAKKPQEKTPYISEKEGRLSFADRGAEFMHEAGGTVGKTYAASLNHSTTSLAIMEGRGGDLPVGAMNATRAPRAANIGQRRGHKAQASDASTARLIPNSSRSPLGFDEALEMNQLSGSNQPAPMMGGTLVKGKGSNDPLIPPAGSVSRNKPPNPLPGTNAFNDSLHTRAGPAIATAVTAAAAVPSQKAAPSSSAPRPGGPPPMPNVSSPAAARSANAPPAGGMRSRSSGWSRYFTNNDATDLAQIQGNGQYGRTSADFSDDARSSQASVSQYTDSRFFPSGNYGAYGAPSNPNNHNNPSSTNNGAVRNNANPYPMYDGSGYDSAGSGSRYNSAHYSGVSHPSQTVPPLELNLGESFERNVSEVSMVSDQKPNTKNSGAQPPRPALLPTTSSGVTILPRGHQDEDDARSWTTASTRDRAMDRDEDAMYNGAVARPDAAWTPVTNAPYTGPIPQMPSFNPDPLEDPPRAVSSFYGSSTGIISHYAPTTGVPSQYGAGASFGAGAPGFDPMRRFQGAGADENRTSNASQLTVFPRGVPSGMSTAQGQWSSGGGEGKGGKNGKNGKNEDMSWIDLNGAGKAM